jgi:hypothetical protein
LAVVIYDLLYSFNLVYQRLERRQTCSLGILFVEPTSGINRGQIAILLGDTVREKDASD